MDWKTLTSLTLMYYSFATRLYTRAAARVIYNVKIVDKSKMITYIHMNTSKVTTIASILEIVEILWYPMRQLSLFKLRTHAQLYVYKMNTSEVTTLPPCLKFWIFCGILCDREEKSILTQ
jgi:hypothetical protein